MSRRVDVVELARVFRDPIQESLHHGVVVVADTGGVIRHAWGSARWVTTPRSALKPFQAIAIIESGAADAFGLTDEHIALACASHAAEPAQVALLSGWLGRLGLTDEALICGPAVPRAQADIAEAYAKGGPRRIYNNCSGKHLGFLSIARHLGASLDYAAPDHPAQRLFRNILSEFTGLDANSLPHGGDGCGLPAIGVPINAMATAAARLGVAQAASEKRRAAVRRVVRAMAAHPDLLAGRDSPTARMIRHTSGNVLLKGGAEGYLIGCVRDRGLGIAIKVADGDPGGRARIGVLARLLGRIRALPTDEAEQLIAAVEPPLADSNGKPIGHVEIVFQPPQRTRPTKASLGFWMSGAPGASLVEFFEEGRLRR